VTLYEVLFLHHSEHIGGGHDGMVLKDTGENALVQNWCRKMVQVFLS